MKKRITLLTLVLTLFLTTFVSAGIYFSQPNEYYNLGDVIKSNVTISPVEEGFVTFYLICDDKPIIITPNSNKNGFAEIEFPLISAWIQNTTGDCYFSAEYSNGVNGKSRTFQISDRLDVSLSMDSLFANPGESITITGFAKRLNGQGINGDIEITIPLLSLLGTEPIEETTEDENTEDEDTSEDETTEDEDSTDDNTEDEETTEDEDSETQEETIEELIPSVDNGIFYGQVENGEFSVTFTLPNDIPAGDYRIDAFAYEKQGEQKTSEGTAMANLNIFQVLTNIDLALNNQNINPGESLNFKPMLKDQSDKPILDEISVIITNEKKTRIFERILQSEETLEYPIPTNQSSGYYEVTASIDELTITKQYYVNEKPRVSFNLENNTLIVTNIGNTPYKKDIQIELDGKPFVKKLNLELGDRSEFKLTGSNQDYSVKISDGETELDQQGVALTGHAVGVKELNSGSALSIKPIIWIFFIIILGAGLIFLLKNILKKKSFAYPFQKKTKLKHSETIEFKAPKKYSEKKQTTPLVPPNQAEQVLVLQGEKSKAAVVVLKIKNKISKFSKQSLERAIEPIYEKRGAVYEQGDYIFIIFSPLMTKTDKNEVIAARTAEKIKIILNEHNKKFKDKIDFGLAVNSGDVINKVEHKKLKFTALKNIITSAKRLAESSDKQILVTKEAYERGISEIKAEKRKINNGDVYELSSVIDSQQNQKFLNK